MFLVTNWTNGSTLYDSLNTESTPLEERLKLTNGRSLTSLRNSGKFQNDRFASRSFEPLGEIFSPDLSVRFHSYPLDPESQ